MGEGSSTHFGDDLHQDTDMFPIEDQEVVVQESLVFTYQFLEFVGLAKFSAVILAKELQPLFQDYTSWILKLRKWSI